MGVSKNISSTHAVSHILGGFRLIQASTSIIYSKHYVFVIVIIAFIININSILLLLPKYHHSITKEYRLQEEIMQMLKF